MEKNNNADSLFTKINPDVKDRARIYITEAKLLKKEVNSMKDLVEVAIDEYIINHPHEKS